MVVLDTCAWVWFVMGEPMRQDALERLRAAELEANLVVSAASVWEVATLARKGRLDLIEGTQAWVDRGTSIAGLMVHPIDAQIALDAATLPGSIHGDPMDRFIIATARAFDAPVVTRDTAILAYGRAGHVRVLRC